MICYVKYIYTLTDPRTDDTRYVGCTVNVKSRYTFHLNDRCYSDKSTWIIELDELGLVPTLHVMECVEKKEARFMEQYYISLFYSFGFPLFNKVDNDGYSNPKHKTNSIRQELIRERLSKFFPSNARQAIMIGVLDSPYRDLVEKRRLITSQYMDKIESFLDRNERAFYLRNENDRVGNKIIEVYDRIKLKH